MIIIVFIHTVKPAQQSTDTLPATPPTSPSLSATGEASPLTPPLAPDEISAEIPADVTVVRNIKELEISFGQMLVQVKRLLDKYDLSEALLFLDSIIGSKEFIGCDNFGKLLQQLRQNHIDVFNVSNLQELVANFDKGEFTEVIEAYIEKKESFLKQTTVLEFQHAVVSRVEPILASGMAVVTIKIPEELATDRTFYSLSPQFLKLLSTPLHKVNTSAHTQAKQL